MKTALDKLLEDSVVIKDCRCLETKQVWISDMTFHPALFEKSSSTQRRGQEPRAPEEQVGTIIDRLHDSTNEAMSFNDLMHRPLCCQYVSEFIKNLSEDPGRP